MKRKSVAACCPARPRAIDAQPRHVAALKALAHLDRLRVFFHLVQAGEALPAGSVQEALEIPAPTLSRHLDQLERAGLIERRRDGARILSAVRHDMVGEIVRLLTACC